ALQAGLMWLDDDAMMAAAGEEFAALTGVRGVPLLTYVKRWPHAMPQYAVGHPCRAATLEAEAAELPYFGLAGAYIRGVGIPDCIASGERAAQAVFTQLTGASC
ncbi:MAG: FAD-dependent oxidoreductase, partial [Candidatus Binataceae bacterium]